MNQVRGRDLTYVNYKVATDRLIAWLFESASRYGVNLPDDMITGEGDAKHFKSVNDCSKLAAVLVSYSESGFRLPPTLAVVIRQAIKLREVRAKNFTDAKHRASNRRHQYFTEELKVVLRGLETTMTEIDLGKLSSSTLCSSDIISAVWSQQSGRHSLTQPMSLEGELRGSEFDKFLAVCTFFEDMAAIRQDIRQNWVEYGTGNLCLTAAAVTTDTAFTIMMASCEEIVQLVPDAPSWLALAVRIKEVADRQNLAESDFLDLTCAKVAFRLNELCQHLHPDHFVMKKHGRFEDYKPGRDRSAWSVEDQDEEDAIILSELFVDVVVLCRTKLRVPAQDCLTAGLRTTVDGGSFDQMPVFVVFAAQIFLDIHHILRDCIARPLDSLQRAGKRACDILDEHFRRERDQSGTSTEFKSTEALQDIMAYIKEWIEDDIVSTALHRHGGSQGTIRPFRLLHNHPILCGLKVFRLHILLQHAGIEMSNASGSVVCAAHIYNAACRSGGLRQPWRDMDYVIDVHTPKRVFCGSFPSLVADYFDRFLLALSVTQRATYEKLHMDSMVGSVGTKNRGTKLKMTSPVRDIFESRYVLDGDAKMTLENVVAMSHAATRRSRVDALSEDTVKFLGEMTAKRQHTTTELLQIVREGVAAEETHFLFDYMGLHHRIVDLLGELYQTFRTALNSSFYPASAVETSNLVLAVAQIFRAVKELDELDRSSTDPGHGVAENILRSLAQSLSEFLGESENGMLGSASLGPARVMTDG